MIALRVAQGNRIGFPCASGDGIRDTKFIEDNKSHEYND